MKIGIIILNWNDAEVTQQCLRAVFGWDSINSAIIVVDNASSDDSADSIVAAYPEINLVRSEINRGFAGGNNLGIVKAQALGCDAILLLNSDAEVSESGVATLISDLDNTHAGWGHPDSSKPDETHNMEPGCPHPEAAPIIIGPAIEEKSVSGSVLTCGGRDIGKYSRTRITCTRRAAPDAFGRGSSLASFGGTGWPTLQELSEVSYVPGTVLLVPSSVFEKVGLLDEDYFFSGEVADFCARAHQQGIDSVIDMSVTAHHGDENEEKPLRGSLYIYYTLRNRFLYVSKHGGNAKFWLKSMWTIKAFCMFGLSIIKLDFSRSRAVALGLIDGWQEKWGNRNDQFGV